MLKRALTRRRVIQNLPGVITLTGCVRKHTRKIAVVPKTTAIDYWESLHAGANNSAESLKVELFWNAPQSESSYAQQALMLEDVIRQKVDGIVLAPSHGSVLASAVRHAKAEGIPLVVVDSPVAVDPSEYVAFIGSDAEEMGRLAATRTGSALDGSGAVAVVGVSPTVEAAVRRERAYAAVMASRFPGVRIVDIRYGLSDHVRSREITTDILADHPALDALFASDQFATRGALIALRTLKNHRVRLIGVAQEQDLLEYMRHGLIDSLVVQDPYSMGKFAVEILGSVFGGEYRGPARIQTRVAIATRECLNEPAIQQLVARR